VNFLLGALLARACLYIVPNADIEIIEEHFRGKKDVSGTAVRIAEALGLDWGQHVNSIRVGGNVGKHEVCLACRTKRFESCMHPSTAVPLAKGRSMQQSGL